MSGGVPPGSRSILERLREPGPMVSVELRPPRSRLSQREGMDVWIDLRHSIQRLARSETPVFLTDNAVGSHEEENLTHLTHNLGQEVGWEQVIPFLTCKHPLEYCLMFARRAASQGFPALTVLGGDASLGPPRCVPHAFQLRQRIREQVPDLVLGGWANPHRSAEEQLGFVASPDFQAEFLLTQVVSHHCLGAVERFLEAHARTAPEVPPVFGVFYYRSATPSTLKRLSEFFPVPAEELGAEFSGGATADQVCARTVRALRSAGAEKIYVSNLGFRRVHERLARILSDV